MTQNQGTYFKSCFELINSTCLSYASLNSTRCNPQGVLSKDSTASMLLACRDVKHYVHVRKDDTRDNI